MLDQSNSPFFFSPTMVLSQFKKLDVKSMEQLYEKKERKKRQRAEQKRRHEREEQQQQQQHQKQAQLPSKALATLLGQTVGVLGATEAQTTSWTSADPFASIGNLDFDSGENFGISEAYTQCDFASLESTEPSCEIGGILSTMPEPTFADDINSHSPSWLSCAPLPAQPSTERAPHDEANPSSAEELSLALDLTRRATGQLRLADSVISATNASVVEVEDSSESSGSCNADETDDDRGSDDEETDVESCHQEMAVPRCELTGKDLSGSPVLHVLSQSKPAAPNCPECPSIARNPFLSDSAKAPVGFLGGLKEPQTGDFSLPTPASDHASDSGQVGHIVTCRKKRGGEPTEGGSASHELRPAKRMRPRKVDNGTKSPALPPRTLRALPSRVPAENSSKRLSNDIETQPRRSAGTPERSEAEDHIDLLPCGKDKLRPDTSLVHDLDDTSKRSRCKEAQQGRSRKISPVPSLRPNHLSRNHDQTERCGLVPPPPINTTANLPVATCHACGFSAKHLLRMINTFETLNGGIARLPDGERRMDMLELFFGFIKNYATERLPHNELITGEDEPYNATHQDHSAEVSIGLSHGDTFKQDDGSDDNTDDNDSQSDNQSGNDCSDHYPSPDSLEENVKMSKRRRWTIWEEERLRVYIEEGKEWSWIAKRLHRSEPAVTQHWVIMERQDKEAAK
ncbi:hypothetical protein CT0861_09526 [Colletotrichum tofieldiae]|uniref:Myb-like domain-containing protein n=1 Tax=Colletotrichum tofieldiae TaxID=708197 RepID=A0A166MTN9_9PEZI|nr:hypothetical protein CT0861_09526 [Colletotrichum tofieldiae]